jgi:hypothetical protein
VFLGELVVVVVVGILWRRSCHRVAVQMQTTCVERLIDLGDGSIKKFCSTQVYNGHKEIYLLCVKSVQGR